MAKKPLSKLQFAQLENFFRLQATFICAQVVNAPKEKQMEILTALTAQRTEIEKWLADREEPSSDIALLNPIRRQ